MPRNSQLVRVLKLLRLLESHPDGIRASDILSRVHPDKKPTEAVRRAMYRDLDALEASGVALVNGDGGEERGVWRLATVTQIQGKIQINLWELFSLYLGRQSLKSFEGSPFFEAMNSVFHKIEKTLGDKGVRALRELDAHIAVRPSQKWSTQVSRDLLDTLHAACVEGHKLNINYISAGGARPGVVESRVVGPECLYFADAGAYLIAFDEQRKDYRTFAVPRIQSAEMLSDAYEPSIASAELFFQHAFGVLGSAEPPVQVEIEIRGPSSAFVSERRWHGSQKLLHSEPGLCRIELCVHTTDEFVKWILGLGSEAKVIAPASVQNLVRNAAQKILLRYQPTKRAA
jgi:predicted DNA-binding transcriptional regulator YafY